MDWFSSNGRPENGDYVIVAIVLVVVLLFFVSEASVVWFFS